MKIFSLLNFLFLQKNVTESKDDFFVVQKEDKTFQATGSAIAETIHNLYGGRSLRIRAIDAGSSNAEEIELTALNNTYYDIERFGLSFVASPRHADILMVSGPVTRNLERALLTTYEATPKPCIVVALGDGACTGGIWKDSYAVVGPVENVIPVDAKIPGDPPNPTEILRGLLRIIKNNRIL